MSVCRGPQVQETHRLVGTILSMQPWLAASAGGEGSGDQFVYDLAQTMEGRIPTRIDMELAHKKLFQVQWRAVLLLTILYKTNLLHSSDQNHVDCTLAKE